jgi:hypothetical protein
MFPSLYRVRHPEIFQGVGRKAPYFEGWYYKNVSSSGETILALIPGISLAADHAHAFIQVIDGKTLQTEYFRFPLESFSAASDRLDLRIGPHHFHSNGFEIALRGESITLCGEVRFDDASLFPSRLLSPGIMGWYSFVPGMECSHGVVSMDHALSGALDYNGTTLSLDGGRGYVEKDWGRSFPSAWIWMQSNHFERRGDSFMFSAATVPWMRKHFNGFTSFLYVSGRVYRFATYTGAVISEVQRTGDFVSVTILDHGRTLNVKAHRSGSGDLSAPVQGAMDRRIAESISARIEILFCDASGGIIFKGEGVHAGLETVGDL